VDQLFPEEPARLTLTKLTIEVNRAMHGLGRVAVEGEVHQPRSYPGGRTFFVLRDRAVQVTVTFGGARARRCRAVHGERVCVTGRVTFAGDRGSLHLEAEEVTPVGEGAVAAMVAETRRRLAADGLLDRPRRRLPRLPALIGVVCGNEAAVRKDIESVVAARFPGYPIVFEEVTVSGAGAADAVASALSRLDRRPDVHVIVLARGGGDATQLLPFSDESLCRAICAAATPVVSAIGHDGDRPLCDDVADLRCGTPSLAAAAVVPDRALLHAEIDRLLERSARLADARVAAAKSRLAAVDRERALERGVAIAVARLDRARGRLALVHPGARAARGGERLAAVRRQLEALSPAGVLQRGYAVVRDEHGAVVRDPGQVGVGDAVEVEVAAGRFGARVT
jgi:exodeoxyribonuclease VII large subunit